MYPLWIKWYSTSRRDVFGIARMTADYPQQELTPHAHDRVRAYYRETWQDYRWLWLSGDDLAIHFGYWDAKTRNHRQALLNLNRELARRMDIQRGQRILDAGCGIGGSSLWLEREHEARMVGVTLEQGQVNRARALAEQQGAAARFRLADYAETGLDDASFDGFWAMESLVHAPDKARVMREAARLVKPGGRLGMVEYLRRERPLPPNREARLRSWLDDWSMPDFGTEAEWRGWIAEAGFEAIQCVDITDNVRPSLRRLYRLAVFFGFGEWLLWLMRLRSRAQHGNIRGSRTQWRALRAGDWREVIITATRSAERA